MLKIIWLNFFLNTIKYFISITISITISILYINPSAFTPDIESDVKWDLVIIISAEIWFPFILCVDATARSHKFKSEKIKLLRFV